MKFAQLTKATATALLCACALVVTAGTANASPAPLIAGADRGVGFSTTTQGGAITTVLDAGAFRIDKTSASVDVVNAAGTEIASIPLVYRVAGKQFSIAPTITKAASTLTLTPQVNAAAVKPVAGAIAFPRHNASSQSRFIAELNKASFGAGVGAAIGAGIGLAVGCVIGIIVGCIPGVLIGAGVGALVGVINAGGPSLQRAAIAYFSGRP